MSKRLKFFLGHLSISFTVALLAIWVVFFIWYPIPLAQALGVTSLFLMLISIDVIMGPVLGFLLYKEGKKGLKFDLTIIIILQISAFWYGFYTLAQARPVWIVYDVLTFHVVTYNDIDKDQIAWAKPEFQHPSWFKPQFVTVDTQPNTSVKKLLDVPAENNIIYNPLYYNDISEAKLRIQLHAIPLARLENYNDKQHVQQVTQKYPEADSWFGLTASQQSMVVLLNKQQGKVIKIVNLRPWN